MEAGGVAWVLAEKQQHSDIIQACPEKTYLYYKSLILLSKRRCLTEEAFLQGESSKKLQVAI